MNRTREAAIIEQLKAQTASLAARLMVELLEGHRENLRDKLEGEDSPENRGRCKEIKDLLAILK